ncbi:expressed unknown protein [Seminavis robusta]|uniref:Uncharacterized protein n=1 Tax=Seminavis robusta TaxID=568900 RepID=A0A9N8DUQ5_9STRA|nr:expressed unknown protein [Seminavis robusta]|eukprot:Sro262_g102110.1 n/a (252) ;mRNA; f:78635-79390
MESRLESVARLISPVDGSTKIEGFEQAGDFNGLGARILSGRPELGHFDYLSRPSQIYPFVIGSESLGLCAGKTSLEILRLIGFDDKYIQNELKNGAEFRMVLFAADETFQMVSPTWDNLLALTYAESMEAGKRLEKHLPVLKPKPFDELVAETGIDFDYLPGDMHRSVNTIHKYAALPDECDTVAHARAFLSATWKCTRLFQGDGYTMDELGNRGVREFICPRRKVTDIQHVWINLPLDLGVFEVDSTDRQ